MKNKRGALILIPLIILLAIWQGVFIREGIMSLTENYGLSPGGDMYITWNHITLQHYKELLEKNFGLCGGNSLIQTLLNVALGLPLGLVIALLLGLIRHRPTKALFAGMFLVLALLPESYWWLQSQNVLYRLPIDARASGYWVSYAIGKSIPLISLCAFGGLALNLAEFKKGAVGALLVGLIPLLTALLPDMRFAEITGNVFSNPSLTGHLYQRGVIRFSTGDAAAAAVLGKMGSLLMGLLPAFLMGVLARRKDAALLKVKKNDKSWATEGFFALLGALVAGLHVMAAALIGKQLAIPEGIGTALLNTLLTGLLSGIFAFGMCTGVLFFTRYSRSRLAFGAIALCLAMLGVFSISGYLLIRKEGLLNTAIPVASAFCVLGHPAFIALLLVLIAARPTAPRQVMLTAAGGGMLAAMISAGDHFAPRIFTSSMNRMPLAALVRQLRDRYSYIPGLPEGEIIPGVANMNGAMAVLLAVCLFFGLLGAMLLFWGLGGGRMQRMDLPGAPLQQESLRS